MKQAKQKTSISSRQPVRQTSCLFQRPVTRTYLGLRASSGQPTGGDLGEQEPTGTPGEGEPVRPLDSTNAITTIAPVVQVNPWTNLRVGEGLQTSPHKAQAVSIPVMDECRNGSGSLAAPLQETGYFWRYQESDAGCEESRGESDSGLDGRWDCHGRREKEEPRPKDPEKRVDRLHWS